jgi:acetolactate synthase-1/2/3 large subunit
VDVPVDVSLGKLTANPDLALDLPGYKPRPSGHLRQIQAAAQAINESQRPLLYVGGGAIISDACEQVRALMHKGHIPVATTLMAMGSVDETDPLALQMLGMHGTATANYAVQDCDCLVAIGARFDDRVTGKVETFAPKAKIIHIDIDATSIGKNIEPHIPVVGDAREVLEKMLPLIEEKVRKPWLAQVASWKAKHPLAFGRGAKIKPQAVMAAVGRLTDHDAFISTGVGQHQMWAAQFCGWKRPRQFITSGGQGTMGFGLPSAIGAQFGNPGKLVIDIDGDGSFSMTMVELMTAVRFNQPVKVVVLDNNYLGMVRQWQEMFYGKRYSATPHPCPNLVLLAQSLGATGMEISHPDQVGDGVAELLKCPGPVVLAVNVEPEENVWPMVAAGKSLHEMDMGRLV